VRSPTTLDSVLPFSSKAISMRSPLISIISTCSPLKVAEEKKEVERVRVTSELQGVEFMTPSLVFLPKSE